MSIPQIITLLEFCLKYTYFLFQGKYFEWIHDVAMGSPISPLIANLFMEEFKIKAISSSPIPYLWLRYVDDNFVIQQAEHCHHFLQHINSQEPPISFTAEDPKEDGSLPFLDTLVSQQHPSNHSLSQTCPCRPIPTLGQQPLPCSQTQHVQHLNTKGQGNVHKLTCFSIGGIPHQTGTTQMQFPPMDP